MAYRFEKQTNGEYEIIIDGFEKGIADSPYTGIANIRNLTVKYYEGVAYVNYKRQACTFSGGSLTNPRFACQSTDGLIYISDDNASIFKQSAVNSSTFTLLTGTRTAGAGQEGLQFWNNYLFAFGPSGVDICGDGTGDTGVTSSNWNTSGGTAGVWPIKNATITLTGSPVAGDTSATISSYTDAQGTSRAFWNGPTGNYLTFIGGSSGIPVIATLTQGVAAFTFYPALSSASAGSTAIVKPVQQSIDGYGRNASLVSINDGNLYFTNNYNVGSFELLPGQTFSKTNCSGNNFRFNSSALGLPPTETAICLTEVRNQLLVGAKFKIYPWDRVSPQWLNPIPVAEQLHSMINILNDVYIFAGNKGNIYISNGYNAERYRKIPDYITGDLVDPTWQWGGVMAHRQKLWFQALALNGQTGAPVLAGIFSIDLDNKSMIMEAQNSFGLVSANTRQYGILIDNPRLSVNYDNYYSAWANGTSNAGGMDFNDTTLWSSNEPLIESDLINVGTAINPKTFEQIEFKLDQPMQSGDSITVYGRSSLSENYVQIGTTTTTVLSAFYQANFQKGQWLQLKATFSCNATATSSSFNRIREIRIR